MAAAAADVYGVACWRRAMMLHDSGIPIIMSCPRCWLSPQDAPAALPAAGGGVMLVGGGGGGMVGGSGREAVLERERDQLAQALERLADVQRELAEGQRNLMNGQKQLAEQQSKLVQLMNEQPPTGP